jgi:Protein of unknown function (DUF559)/NUMOD3 motif
MRKGSRHRPESLEKISASSRGRAVSLETRAKLSVAFKGRKPSSETLAGKRRTGWEVTTGMRRKISETLTGRCLSISHKEAIRQGMLRSREQLSASLKTYWQTLSVEAKQKAVRKLRGSTWRSRPEIAFGWALFEAGLIVERQFVFNRFLCDFAVPSARLLIEIDGEYWHSFPNMVARDRLLDLQATIQGWSVLHIPASLVQTNLRGTAHSVVSLVGGGK